jgi:hypothetical protein
VALSFTKRLRVPICLVTVALATPGLSVLPTIQVDQPVCARADAWIARNADDLPSTLSDLLQVPVDYRRRIYDKLSDELRTRIWLENFARIQARDGATWTDEQSQFVNEMRSEMAAGRVLGRAYQSQREALVARGVKLFSRQAAMNLMTLESSPVMPTSTVALRLRMSELMRDVVRTLQEVSASVHAQDPPPPCICNATGWCQWAVGPSIVCCPAESLPSPCSHTSSGCGWFWLDPCLGSCIEQQFCSGS